MKQSSSGEWIDHFLTHETPRHKSLVMTLCGDTIAPHGGAFWLGSMIELLAPLGVNDRLVRTSVFRLVQEGWLVASREGRRSRYTLEPKALPRLARANRRIYSPPGLDWNGRWTFLLAPSNSIDTELRNLLRKELEWEGYAMLATGVMAHPAPDRDSLREILARCDAEGKVFACEADELPGVGSRPLPQLVRDGWDLAGVVDGYRRFIDSFAPLLAQLEGQPGVAPKDAFAIRSLLVHAYRRVQLHDPMLPVALLPQPWPGTEAYELARRIYRLAWAPAEEHVMALLRHEDKATPDADADFYQRFGGLRA
ncbi:phenylacetic acid degradation operon negative regulatory protein PaaX [Massilia sp. ST3]|uniref:phenylacetic acid degradation operon negative regulatory protein PaaX n=1 Tax=Massilia sp. ST3 TaxID=2824903 RepID=UPI001B81EF4C|nr:phenylacetic acid degradation operon negative regulatory protein PaaX [Massilia sp. ST3]MBQ5946344.1 phenylacetic acid degradation operon negative regulatory protein PaaX [Massilia sp. ST3]